MTGIKRTLAAACLCAAAASRAHVAAAPQHVHGDVVLVSAAATADPVADDGKAVKFRGAERELTGRVFEPAGTGPFPAIVEIHGINGISSWDSEVGRKLAAEGYLTLAVDLFGRTPRDYGDGLRLRDRFRPKLPDDLRAAVAYLRTLPNVDPKRIGTLGWCMGGGYSLLLATAEPTLAATVMYYGPVAPPPGPTEEELKRIQSPVIAFFGEDDASLPLPEIKLFRNNMREFGKEIEFYIYPDAGHGFAERQTRPPTHGEAMVADPAADSWQKTLAFLKKHLGR
jgi:carboxymethylenebutenolidase